MTKRIFDGRLKLLPALLVVGLLLPAAVVIAAGGDADHRLWAELLGKYVQNGMVDYAGFQRDEARLDRYLEKLAAIRPGDLTRNGRFAFYVNAYNAWTVKLILGAYPDIKSIKDLGGLLKSPWQKPIARIDNQTLTLDEIEHQILRPQFKDPRIHFAVNCASKSCPPLISEPYRADRLDQQLEEVTRSFLNHPDNYRFDGTDFYVSRIFKWYGEDFDDDVIGFYLTYAENGLKARLEAARPTLKVKYLDYDWGLNGR